VFPSSSSFPRNNLQKEQQLFPYLAKESDMIPLVKYLNIYRYKYKNKPTISIRISQTIHQNTEHKNRQNP
jgi:LytS/YehU family sensor histidine kinase